MKLNVNPFIFLFILLCISIGSLFFRGPLNIDSSLYNLLPLQQGEIPEKVTSKYASNINIIIESRDFERAKTAADKLYTQIQENDIPVKTLQLPQNILDRITHYANTHQSSFLLEKDRENILNNKTSLVVQDSINFISSSLVPVVVPIDKDPFSLANKYIFSLAKISSSWQLKDNVLWQKKNGLNYIFISIPVDTSDVEQITKNIEKIKKYATSVDNTVSIHISGAPIHTADMYAKSKTEVSIISFLACLSSVILTFLLFKRKKLVIIVAANLFIAFISGFLSLILFYNKIHLLTFAFGASLIGICIDYSFHKIYTMSAPTCSKVRKELLYSFITTVICFIPLLFSSIPLLKQISVFTIGGLIGTFIWVTSLPIKYTPPQKKEKIFTLSKRQSQLTLVIICAITLIGLFGLNIRNEVSSFYKPEERLQKEEKLFYQLNDDIFSKILIVKGKEIDEVIEIEEDLSRVIDIKGISKFLPSQRRQEENYELLKKLYSSEGVQIQKELGLPEVPRLSPLNIITKSEFIKNFGESLFHQFIIEDGQTIWSVLPISGDIKEVPKNTILFSPKEMITQALDICAKETYISICFSMLILGILLFIFYKRQMFLYLAPSVIGVLGTLAIINSVYGAITFFHLISLFIVIGLSIDYTIFNLSKNNTESIKPVFFSFLSSVIGFGLLSIASFNIIAAMGQTIAIGLSISYITSFALICFKRD